MVEVTLTGQRQLTIPKSITDQMELNAGDKLTIEVQDTDFGKELVLRKLVSFDFVISYKQGKGMSINKIHFLEPDQRVMNIISDIMRGKIEGRSILPTITLYVGALRYGVVGKEMVVNEKRKEELKRLFINVLNELAGFDISEYYMIEIDVSTGLRSPY